jgi:hypothetical protein
MSCLELSTEVSLYVRSVVLVLVSWLALTIATLLAIFVATCEDTRSLTTRTLSIRSSGCYTGRRPVLRPAEEFKNEIVTVRQGNFRAYRLPAVRLVAALIEKLLLPAVAVSFR